MFSFKMRFDFLIKDNNTKSFVEVKNVTLSRTNNLAEFLKKINLTRT